MQIRRMRGTLRHRRCRSGFRHAQPSSCRAHADTGIAAATYNPPNHDAVTTDAVRGTFDRQNARGAIHGTLRRCVGTEASESAKRLTRRDIDDGRSAGNDEVRPRIL